jgi:diadenosine tetraphosphatase ApaH/serine/threonine PP2A family protein phosphatase
MLVAILSDIHGNIEALDAVWLDMAPLQVERVVCLGDVVGYGPNPEEAVISVRERGVLCCMGNHELGLVNASERAWFNTTAQKGLGLTASLLSSESFQFMASLPRFVCLAEARFVHGFPPDSVTTYLFDVDEEELVAWFGRGEALTFVGHTHDLGLVSWNGTEVERRDLVRERFVLDGSPCLVNAGSVGQPRDGNNNAKYLIWDTQTGLIEVRFVPYDIEHTVAKIRARGFPEYYATRLW